MITRLRRCCIAFAMAALSESCSDGSSATTPTGQSAPSTPQPTPVPTPSPTPTPTPTPTPVTLTADETLFELISRDEPFTSYRLFPNTTEISTGRLDGAGAHPNARVRINTPAFQSLVDGRLPSGGRFRPGSVIVKEVLSGNVLLAVMRRDGPNAGAGWQWAEFRTDGSVVYSSNSRGGSCIECHSRQQGVQNDLVRTFERQQ
jgi:hypothetical protein